ncbi:alpha/beta hydrolase [Nocardia sp. NPDC049149]|uniref:WXG100-like domain-containing protein n=1 Tax=Nocardia sp. NPDC049149 TaxID=3364315 RepID=UPI00371BE949
MTITMPPWLEWVSYLAGSEWPEGDEDQLFGLGDDWKRASSELRTIIPDLKKAADITLLSYDGDGADAMRADFDTYFKGDTSIESLAKGLADLGDYVRNCGTQIEYSKLQIITTLAITAAEIAWALTTLFGSAAVPAIETAAQIAARNIFQRMLDAILRVGAKFASQSFMKKLGITVVVETAIGLGQELGIQAYQVGRGRRDHIDWKQVGIAAATSAAGAAVAFPVAHGAGTLINKWAGPPKSMWGAGFRAVGAAVPAGLAGVGGGFIAGGILTGEWEFDPRMLGGAIGGALSGAVSGVTEYRNAPRPGAGSTGRAPNGNPTNPRSLALREPPPPYEAPPPSYQSLMAAPSSDTAQPSAARPIPPSSTPTSPAGEHRAGTSAPAAISDGSSTHPNSGSQSSHGTVPSGSATTAPVSVHHTNTTTTAPVPHSGDIGRPSTPTAPDARPAGADPGTGIRHAGPAPDIGSRHPSPTPDTGARQTGPASDTGTGARPAGTAPESRTAAPSTTGPRTGLPGDTARPGMTPSRADSVADAHALGDRAASPLAAKSTTEVPTPSRPDTERVVVHGNSPSSGAVTHPAPAPGNTRPGLPGAGHAAPDPLAQRTTPLNDGSTRPIPPSGERTGSSRAQDGSTPPPDGAAALLDRTRDRTDRTDRTDRPRRNGRAAAPESTDTSSQATQPDTELTRHDGAPDDARSLPIDETGPRPATDPPAAPASDHSAVRTEDSQQLNGIQPPAGNWKPMPENGDGVFHALAEVMGLGKDGHLDLRARLTVELNLNREFYRADFGNKLETTRPERLWNDQAIEAEFDRQLNQLIRNGTHNEAADFVIPLAARVFELNLVVLHADGSITSRHDGFPGQPVGVLYRETADSGHYRVAVHPDGTLATVSTDHWIHTRTVDPAPPTTDESALNERADLDKPVPPRPADLDEPTPPLPDDLGNRVSPRSGDLDIPFPPPPADFDIPVSPAAADAAAPPSIRHVGPEHAAASVHPAEADAIPRQPWPDSGDTTNRPAPEHDSTRPDRHSPGTEPTEAQQQPTTTVEPIPPSWVDHDASRRWLNTLEARYNRIESLLALNEAELPGRKLLYLGGDADIEHPLLATRAEHIVLVSFDPAAQGDSAKRTAHLDSIAAVIEQRVKAMMRGDHQLSVEKRQDSAAFTVSDGTRTVQTIEFIAKTYDEFVETHSEKFDFVMDKDSWFSDWKSDRTQVFDTVAELLRPGGHWIGGHNILHEPTQGFRDRTEELIGHHSADWSGGQLRVREFTGAAVIHAVPEPVSADTSPLFDSIREYLETTGSARTLSARNTTVDQDNFQSFFYEFGMSYAIKLAETTVSQHDVDKFIGAFKDWFGTGKNNFTPSDADVLHPILEHFEDYGVTIADDRSAGTPDSTSSTTGDGSTPRPPTNLQPSSAAPNLVHTEVPSTTRETTTTHNEPTSIPPTPHLPLTDVDTTALVEHWRPLLENPSAQPISAAKRHAVTVANEWKRLSAEQQNALIEHLPRAVGDNQGIPAADRDRANRSVITRQLDELRAKDRLTPMEQRQLRNLEDTQRRLTGFDETARSLATKGAVTPPPVHVLHYDATAFNGLGRAVISIGNVDAAHSVSWHVGGVGNNVLKLGRKFGQAADHYLQTLRHLEPGKTAASVVWLGYEHPQLPKFGKIFDSLHDIATPWLAKKGGELLARDIATFNAVRGNARGAGTSAEHTNYLFAHSYGSTVTAYAGEGGRLRREVGAITLLGSPGAGPLQHASHFGLRDNKVYVVSSAWDVFTQLGTGRQGLRNLIPLSGLGIDPSIQGFGAARLHTGYLSGWHSANPLGPHANYYNFHDADGHRPTGSLDSFAKIAAGLAPDISKLGRRDAAPIVDPTRPRPERITQAPSETHGLPPTDPAKGPHVGDTPAEQHQPTGPTDPEYGESYFGEDLLTKLGSESTVGTTDPQRTAFSEEGLRPPTLSDAELLHNLAPADRTARQPAVPVHLRGNELTLIDAGGQFVRLPDNSTLHAISHYQGTQHFYDVLPNSGPNGRWVRLPAELLHDFTFQSTTGNLGVLTRQVSGGGTRFIDANTNAVVHLPSDATYVAKPESGTLKWIKDPKDSWWHLVNAPNDALPMPITADRHNDPLFGPGGPKSEDVRQGTTGDCYLLADLMNLATHNPDLITEIIHDHGDGTVSVRFMVETPDGPPRPEWVRVEKQIYVSPDSGRGAFAGHEPGGPLWPAMVEKAYALQFGKGLGFHGIDGGLPGETAGKLGKGFYLRPDGGFTQPVRSTDDYEFLRPFVFDVDTLHEQIGGDLEFSRQFVAAYDDWVLRTHELRTDTWAELNQLHPGDADTATREYRTFLGTEDLGTPEGFRGYLDERFGTRWPAERSRVEEFMRTAFGGDAQDRHMGAFTVLSESIGHRIQYALDRGTTVTLTTHHFGAGRENTEIVPGLVGGHVYSLVGIEHDANGRPIRVVLENPWNHNGDRPQPIPGIEYRTHPDGSVYGVNSDGTRYRQDSDGTLHMTRPDDLRFRQDPDGTRTWTEPNGSTIRENPDGTIDKYHRLSGIGPDPTVQTRQGIIAVDLTHMPKFAAIGMHGAGAHGLYGPAKHPDGTVITSSHVNVTSTTPEPPHPNTLHTDADHTAIAHTDDTNSPATHESIIAGVNEWTSSRRGFNNPQYTPAEFVALINEGHALGLDDRTIGDLIKIGSRAEKALTASELTTQMQNWANVVSERGFPYKFNDLEHFQRFNNDLLGELTRQGLPTETVYIQGSSLRKPTAQDVDLAVFINQEDFDGILTTYFATKIRTVADNAVVPVRGLNHDQLIDLAKRINADPDAYNSNAKGFARAIDVGIINSKHAYSRALKDVAKAIIGRYPELQIDTVSFLIRGGDFDTRPAMQVSPHIAFTLDDPPIRPATQQPITLHPGTNESSSGTTRPDLTRRAATSPQTGTPNQHTPQSGIPNQEPIEIRSRTGEPVFEQPPTTQQNPTHADIATDETATHPVIEHPTTHEEIVARVNEWTNARAGFNKPQYTPEEFVQLIDKARALGIDDRTTEDLIKIGSRTKKALTAAVLAEQMQNWAEVVSVRGYPYKFTDQAGFQKFSNQLVSELTKANIPTDAVYVQGSALRTPEAQDVDLAVFIDQHAYDQKLISYFDGKMKTIADGMNVPLTGLSHTQLAELAKDIKSTREAADKNEGDKKYNAKSNTFERAFHVGLINSKNQEVSDLKKVAKIIKGAYPELAIDTISFLIRDGDFDTMPAMQVMSRPTSNQSAP